MTSLLGPLPLKPIIRWTLALQIWNAMRMARRAFLSSNPAAKKWKLSSPDPNIRSPSFMHPPAPPGQRWEFYLL